MKKNPASQSGLINPRILLACALCSVGVFLAALGFASAPASAGWSLVTSPNNGNNNLLFGITCTSDSDCWAVGNYLNSDLLMQTLTEHWNGSSWSLVPSPNTSANQNNSLNGIACASPSDCWAVGSYIYYDNAFPFPAYHTVALIEHWDGAAWSIVDSPNINALSAVACISASNCWAVGADIAHWDGASWSTYGSGSTLKSITCLSGSDCWAVGGALIKHWDGASWTVVPEPNDDAELGNPDYLAGVSCLSASDCWAAGSQPGEEYSVTLTEHWNGSSWVIVPSPNPQPIGGAFSSLTCVSPSQCWAVGSYFDGNASQTLIEQWNGSSWTIVNSPSPSSRLNRLYSVTCPSSSTCWTVGDQLNASGAQLTLFEEFAPTIPPLTGVVSRKIHGSAGAFDINLPLTGPRGVECRSGGANGNYRMVFMFVNNVTNCGTTSTGSLSAGPGPNRCTVNLTGVANKQYITVTLNNVLDSQNNTGNVAATMGVLIGDTSGNRSVNASDVSLTKSKSGQAANSTNFRTDVSVNGTINSSDVSLVKSKSGTALP